MVSKDKSNDLAGSDREFGRIEIKLQSIIDSRKIKKSQLSYRSELTRGQINKLCKGETIRADFNTLARLCYVLNCRIEDILEYVPPKKEEAEKSNNTDSTS